VIRCHIQWVDTCQYILNWCMHHLASYLLTLKLWMFIYIFIVTQHTVFYS